MMNLLLTCITYVGGRKCIPNFCGGLEDIILKGKHNHSHVKSQEVSKV